MTFGELLQWAISQCKEARVESVDCERLFCDLLHYPNLRGHDRSQLLTEAQVELIRSGVIRRLEGEPVAYICGETHFYGLDLVVDHRVLIPRPETEELVDRVVQEMRAQAKAVREDNQWTVIDLCCGSGAVGLALAHTFPNLTAHLTDLSPDALEVAKTNARRCGLIKRCTFRLGDFLQACEGVQADWIICNPPYISEEEWRTLSPEVRDWEPKLALVGEENGLAFYRRLAEEGWRFLRPGGKLAVECGWQQAEEVARLFERFPWRAGRIVSDLSGHQRFYFVESESHIV